MGAQYSPGEDVEPPPSLPLAGRGSGVTKRGSGVTPAESPSTGVLSSVPRAGSEAPAGTAIAPIGGVSGPRLDDGLPPPPVAPAMPVTHGGVKDTARRGRGLSRWGQAAAAAAPPSALTACALRPAAEPSKVWVWAADAPE